MSTCWKCNNELTSGDEPNSFLCRACHDRIREEWKTFHLREQLELEPKCNMALTPTDEINQRIQAMQAQINRIQTQIDEIKECAK